MRNILTSYANGAAASISMLFIVVDIVFGLIQKKVGKMKEAIRAVVAIALLVVMFAIGMHLPLYATKTTWIHDNVCISTCTYIT